MAEHQRSDRGIEIRADELADYVVRQVPPASHYTLFDGPGIGADFEHFEIVVRFEQQQIGAAQMELDGVGDISQIGDQSYFNAMRSETEANRIDGVVWNGEAIDFNVTHTKGCSGLKAIQARREFTPWNRGRRQASDEDRNVEQTRQSNQPADVIGMLVRDQDGVELFGIFFDGGEAGQNVAPAQAGVDKDARFFGADESGISRAAAGENANFNDGAPPCPQTACSRARLRTEP